MQEIDKLRNKTCQKHINQKSVKELKLTGF